MFSIFKLVAVYSWMSWFLFLLSFCIFKNLKGVGRTTECGLKITLGTVLVVNIYYKLLCLEHWGVGDGADCQKLGEFLITTFIYLSTWVAHSRLILLFSCPIAFSILISITLTASVEHVFLNFSLILLPFQVYSDF